MLTFLKKGADVFIKAAITPTTSKLPHQESVGKYLGGIIKSIIPNQQTPAEKNFDLKMHNRTYKLGVELPGSTRTAGHETEVAMKIPSYKLPYQAIQKFAAWQEQDKQGNVEETQKGTLTSLITPLSAAKELVKSKTAGQYFEQLKALDNQLSKSGGKVIVDSTPGRYKQGVTIELDVSGKSIELIEKDVAFVLQSLDIHDSKLVQTFSKRLYKSCTDPKMSSADIQDKKTNHNTDSTESSPINQRQDVLSANQEQDNDIVSSDQEQNHKASQTTKLDISSRDFSLTNPKDMPYPKHPLQNSQMLQQLQSQILMQQKPEKMPTQPISATTRQEVAEIAENLSQGLSEDQIENSSSKTNRQLTNSNPGKAHAR
ncbi:hypothetical protein [Ehrlichia japonica]|uniref:Uncharacterized protein n=1 Tax=Ehrlichia japonica TaxID=391036 RepID=X5H3J1_9RICK|nr:hypothetical protein [Ehrlichia japonica]AHX04640.1 hypothetical protein EHF_0724 [Ehrlichia japonica]